MKKIYINRIKVAWKLLTCQHGYLSWGDETSRRYRYVVDGNSQPRFYEERLRTERPVGDKMIEDGMM